MLGVRIIHDTEVYLVATTQEAEKVKQQLINKYQGDLDEIDLEIIEITPADTVDTGEQVAIRIEGR